MNRLTPLALVALVLFLCLWGYCHFGHSHPVPVPGGPPLLTDGTTPEPVDVTKVAAVIGSILSAIVALITGVRDLVNLWRSRSQLKPTTDT